MKRSELCFLSSCICYELNNTNASEEISHYSRLLQSYAHPDVLVQGYGGELFTPISEL